MYVSELTGVDKSGERFEIDLMHFRAENQVYSFEEPSVCHRYFYARTLEIVIFIRLSRDENVYYYKRLPI